MGKSTGTKNLSAKVSQLNQSKVGLSFNVVSSMIKVFTSDALEYFILIPENLFKVTFL